MDKVTAQKLLDKGYLNQDTFDRMYGANPQPVTQDMLRSPKELARRQAGKEMLSKQEKKTDEKIADVEQKAAIAAGIAPPQPIAQPVSFQQAAPVQLATDITKPQEPGTNLFGGLNLAQPYAGYDLQQQAIAQGAVAGAAKAAETAAHIRNVQKDVANMRKSDEDWRTLQQNNLAKRQSDLDQELDRVSKLSIDPNRFWANKDTADKVQIGIGLFLGAFGGAAGTGNKAAQMIERAIANDVSMQEADIASQARSIDKRRGILADLRDNFKDMNQAKQAAIAAYLQDAQLKVNEIASKYEAPEVKAKAAQLIGELEIKKQEAGAKYMKDILSKQPVRPDAMPELLTEEQRDRFVPGYGLALNKEDAKAAKELVGNFSAIKDNIGQLMALSNTAGASVSPELRAKAETISSMLIGQLRVPIVGPGAVTEKELELLHSIVANPTNIFSLDSNNKIRLQTLRERMNAQEQSQLKARGLFAPTEKLGFKPLAQK